MFNDTNIRANSKELFYYHGHFVLLFCNMIFNIVYGIFRKNWLNRHVFICKKILSLFLPVHIILNMFFFVFLTKIIFYIQIDHHGTQYFTRIELIIFVAVTSLLLIISDLHRNPQYPVIDLNMALYLVIVEGVSQSRVKRKVSIISRLKILGKLSCLYVCVFMICQYDVRLLIFFLFIKKKT